MDLLFANDRAGHHAPSWYADTTDLPDPAPPLAGDVRADVCVIGAGYTGLSAALHLAEAGVDVVLLEAHRVGFGASGRNGGQVGSGQRQDQHWLETHARKGDAARLWDLAEAAKALVRRLITVHGIDAAYRPGVLHADRHAREVGVTHRYAEQLARDYGYDQLEPLDRDGIGAIVGSDVFQGGVLDHGAGHLHPLRLAVGLGRAARKAGVRLFEGTRVDRVVPRGHDRGVQKGHDRDAAARVITGQGQVTADHIVLACNGYLGGLDGDVAAKVMPINNFIVATEPLGDRADGVLARDVAVADSRFVVNYWRLSEDRRLLFGGGESYGYRFPRDIAAKVRRPMLAIYPQLADVQITHAWGGTLAITRSRMPYFARPSPGVIAASGYSGHGVAMATMAGRMVAEAIAGNPGDFDLMASLRTPPFPGGPAMRAPLLTLAMSWFALRDRLGV